MFDFSSYRNAGGKERLNTKGLLCYDHVTKKDAYYFFKANWNKDDKFVYLTSKRFTQRNKPTQQIKAYSNCDNAELFLNGKSLGAGTKQQDGVFVWNNVKLAAQTANSIKVVAHNGSKSYEDSVDGVWTKDVTPSTAGKRTMYRLYNPNTGEITPEFLRTFGFRP